MASGATTTIAGDYAVVRPANRLLVNELYGGVGLGLAGNRVSNHIIILRRPKACPDKEQHT